MVAAVPGEYIFNKLFTHYRILQAGFIRDG